MTLHQLRIFQAAATYLSVTKAARDIHLRQPSVSKQLKLLEQELGVQLHVRKEQGIKLTEEGMVFLDAIEPILKQIDEVKMLFADNALQKKPAFLKVGGSQSPSALMLPQAFSDFKKTHPHVNLTLRTADSAMIEQMVLNREVEIGVVTNPRSNPKLSAEPLCSEKVVAIVSPLCAWPTRPPTGRPAARSTSRSSRAVSTAGLLTRARRRTAPSR